MNLSPQDVRTNESVLLREGEEVDLGLIQKLAAASHAIQLVVEAPAVLPGGARLDGFVVAEEEFLVRPVLVLRE